MGTSVAGIACEQGKFFIARRIPGGDLGEKWEFPGGKVEPGESDGEALIREYEEEFGVPVEIGALLGTVSFEHHGCTRTLNAYRVYFSRRDFTLKEHTEWRWADVGEIETLDFADSDRKLLPGLKTLP
ncbi:MAG: (deoxy)nucleoside triphosphate pyrophosphohydrolase [Spirochaetaceae bacterium]|jgi:8-oxo-dGTP diphosphatase|nr:(deoxy)nucleoside triphosphate pyrophosphohydrolase [Spirochaetaceae bacterium]